MTDEQMDGEPMTDERLAEVNTRLLDFERAPTNSLRRPLAIELLCCKDAPELLAEVRRLRAELVEAKRDTERLDWLQGHISIERQIEANGAFSITVSGFRGETLRGAIDAAMANELAKEPRQ